MKEARFTGVSRFLGALELQTFALLGALELQTFALAMLVHSTTDWKTPRITVTRKHA